LQHHQEHLGRSKRAYCTQRLIGMVYLIPSQDCPSGQAGRTLHTTSQNTETFSRIRNPSTSDLLSEHAINSGHAIAWDNT